MPRAHRVLVDFVFWSSTAGLPHLGRAKTRCLGAFWLIIWCLCLICFVIQLYSIIVTYLSYNIVVRTELIFKPMTFPAVTICSLNPYKASKFEKYPELKELTTLYAEATNQTLDPSNDKYGFLRGSHSMDRVDRARDIMRYLTAEYPEISLEDITHDYDDLIHRCSFGRQPCGALNFTPMFDPTYGRCFTFNTDMVSMRAGAAYGLRLFVYMNSSETLEMIDSVGVRVTVSSPDEPIFPNSFGQDVESGYTTSLALKYLETNRLPYPYRNCTMPELNETYSQEACFRDCMQMKVVDHCGCQDPQSTLSNSLNESYCDYTQLDCVTAVTTADERTVDVSNCLCSPLCREITYETEVSISEWPSHAYMATLCSMAPPDVDCGTYADDTLFIELYYERLNYQSHVERLAYPFECMLSDVGGDIGLWLGVSFISILEFVFLPMMLAGTMCSRKTATPERRVTYRELGHNVFDRIGGSRGNWTMPSRRNSCFPNYYQDYSLQKCDRPVVYNNSM